MVRLESGKFLTELNRLYDTNRDTGSVFITMKRTNEKSRKGKDKNQGEYKCLVRATDGRHKKISTIVPLKDLEKFKDSFGTILKAKMDGLKKRERKRKSAVTN
jgi:signal recognition particle subunit SRP14